MKSRWNDAEAAKLEGLDLLVYASRLVGAETSLVVWGGGNTSIKTVERDHRGREIGVLRVKGSGSDLKSVQRKDFPGVRMDDIRALLERQHMGAQEMVGYLAHALQDPGGVRPSIETLLHGFVDAHAVVHTHADAIVSLTNNDRPREVLAGVYGKDVIALDYRRPGFRISREVADAIAEHPEARALVLERHGTITWGARVRDAYEATMELITRAEEAIAAKKKGRRVFGGPRVPVLEPAQRRAAALALAPRLRGRLGRERRVIVAFDDADKVTEFTSSAEPPRPARVVPATPDNTIYTKRLPCFVPLDRAPESAEGLWSAVDGAIATFVRDYTGYFEAHRAPGAELTDPLPRVVLVPGLGMFTAGRDRRTAGIVDDIVHHTIDVIGNASAFGRYVSLTAKDAYDVEYWPLELYKLTLAPPEKEQARRIVLVTGGGSGIGRAVAKRLAAEGAHVVVGDLDEAGARKTAEEVTAAAGGGRAIGLRMDVTSEASVRAAFETTVLAYGGLDILVSNAGVAHSAPVDRMALAASARASCRRTSPRPCCSSPPTARPRRPAARSPWTAASRTPFRGERRHAALRRPALAQAAARAVRPRPTHRGARLRQRVDGRPRVLPQSDVRVAHAARWLRADHEPPAPWHRRLPARAAAARDRRQDHLDARRAVRGASHLRRRRRRREPEGVRAVRRAARRARRARERGDRRRAHAVARHARDVQGALHEFRGRVDRPEARAEARATHLDRRSLRRRARARRPARGRLGLVRGPARALRAEPRQDPLGGGRRRAQAGGLRRRTPGLRHRRPRLRVGQGRVGGGAHEALRAELRAPRAEVRDHRHPRAVRGGDRALSRRRLQLRHPQPDRPRHAGARAGRAPRGGGGAPVGAWLT